MADMDQSTRAFLMDNAASCLINGYTQLTYTEEGVIQIAIDKLKRKVRIYEGELARRKALPEEKEDG